MSILQIIYFIGAAAVGFLIGIIFELWVDVEIVRDAKEQVRALKIENARLRSIQPSEVIEITDRSVDAENIPSFTQDW